MKQFKLLKILEIEKFNPFGMKELIKATLEIETQGETHVVTHQFGLGEWIQVKKRGYYLYME